MFATLFEVIGAASIKAMNRRRMISGLTGQKYSGVGISFTTPLRARNHSLILAQKFG